jgi:malonyl-CoA/methylmalonyl-CoA synthetase
VFHPLNSAYTATEVGFFIADAEPKVLVATAARMAEIAETARQQGISVLFTLEADGTGTLTEAAAAAKLFADTVHREPGDLAALLYTSGTTGRAKGAMITHGNLASNAEALIACWELAEGETLIHALPIYHVHGLFVALNTALLGGLRLLWMEKFEARAVLAALQEAQVMMGVPTFYARLLAEHGLNAAASAGMRLFVSGSAPLLAETHARFRERTDHAILERYGMTETGMITSNPYRGDRIAGTVGYPLPGVSVRVTDDRGYELPRGQTGNVEVKGPNVFAGYWRLPDKTRDEFRPDGFFITGDQGVMAADGRLSLVGRAKDLIITGGLNVYPIEIEQALNALPGIGESAVIGVPHADFGEAVVAVVIPAAQGGAMASESEIIAALSRQLAKFKCPKRVVALDELPRNSMGKVSKAQLRERFKALLG